MMNKLAKWSSLFFGLFLLAAPVAHADTNDVTIGSVSQFVLTNWGEYSVVHVESYYAGGTVGGGDFIQTTCTPDLGNCFADSATHTFKRLKPLWDAAEWGAIGDGGTTNNSTRLNNMMTAAVTAKQLTVTISQNGQYYASTGITIPANLVLQCTTSASAQAEDATGAQTGDHKNYPYTILIPASTTVTIGTSKGVAAKMKGCNVENKDVFDTANPTTYQSLLTTLAAFGGTGVTCGGDGCAIEDALILGFTTGWTGTSKDTTQVHNVTVDATNCFSLTNSQFIVGDWDYFTCSGILTTRLSFGLLHLPIDTIGPSIPRPANYTFHLATPCVDATGNCEREGNTIWIAQPPGSIPVGVESAAGRCTVHYIDPSNFECSNSQATPTVSTGTTVLGSTRVCGFAANSINFVRQLQQVSGAGISGGTTVASVNSRMNCVFLSAQATASAAVAITFTDNAYSGPTQYQASLWTNNRLGTGFALNNVNNGKFLHCKVDGHFPAYLWTAGSAHNTFEGCGGEGENNNLDAAAICLDIEGGSANSWYGGSCHYGTNQGTTVLNNNVTGSNVAMNMVRMNDTGSTGIANLFLDSEAGPIDYESSSGSAASHGDIFIADATQAGSTISNVYSLGANVRYQSATAHQKVKGTNNTFVAGSTVAELYTPTNTVTASTTSGQAAATRTGTDYVRVNAVATAGDGVMLRPAIAGTQQILTNASTRAMQVYGYFDTSDTINGIATGIGISQPPGTTWLYVSTANGAWYVNNLFGVAPFLFSQGNTALTVPADTTEDTLATIILPANSLGANGCVVLRTTWSETASANAKTMRAYLGGTGGTKFFETQVTSGTALASTRLSTICNRNVTNSQVSTALDGNFANSAQAVSTGAQDTTTALNIVITGQKATAGESLVLQQYSITLEPHN